MLRATERRLARSAIPLVMVGALLPGACAEEESQRVNTDRHGVAISGYDAVAYFTQGQPVRGLPEFEHDWQEARWRFASAAHRDLFAGDPESYAPQYGGNCAGGMALGKVRAVDPEAWAIVDGKLYLSYNKRYAAEFVENAPARIPQADAAWEALGRAESPRARSPDDSTR